jgi:hypothetical protein
MAKDQGLTLNPKKVSGMCGRLMCCLVYEQQVYKRMRRALPRPGKLVRTEAGVSKVLSIDVINQRVTVELPDTNRRTLHVSEIAPHDPDAEPVASPPAEVKYLWDDVLPDEPAAEEPASRRRGARRRGAGGDAEEKPSRRRRRRRSRSRSTSTDDAAPAEAATKDGQPKPEKSKRRRRRRRGGRRGDKNKGDDKGNQGSGGKGDGGSSKDS